VADTFLLSPSANNNSPLIQVVNAFVSRGIKLHVTRSGTLSESCPRSNFSFAKNKMRVGTYNHAKGLQAKDGILLHTHELFGAKSRAFYVALTRVERRLIILAEAKWVNKDMLQRFAELCEPENIEIIVHRNLMATNQERKLSSAVPTSTSTSISTSIHASIPTSVARKPYGNSNRVPPIKISADLLNADKCNIFHLPELFSFVDVNHIMHLLSQLKIELITAPFDDIPAKPAMGEEQDYMSHFDLLNHELQSQYANDMIVVGRLPEKASSTSPQDENHSSPSLPVETHTSVLHYVGEALSMAAEFLLGGGKVPYTLYELHNTMDPSHPYYSRMIVLREQVQLACSNLLSTPSLQEKMTIAQVLLPIFAELSAMRDAFRLFADKYNLIPNYQFVTKPSVFLRLERLVQNLYAIRERYSKQAKITFHEAHSTHLIIYGEDGQKQTRYQITGNSGMCISDRAVVWITHSPTIGSDDRLSVAALAECAAVRDAYLLNLYDGTLEKISVADPLQFLGDAIYAKTDIQQDMTDKEFFDQFMLPCPAKADPDDWIDLDGKKDTEFQDPMYLSEDDG
jgi:hypothetical protein